MKKNLTKKLMLSVLTLAFAVVSLGASTFAWFTTSEKAGVDEITYNVTSDAGLEVAVSKVGGDMISNFYIGTLPAAQIEAVVAATGFTEFNNVTYYDVTNQNNAFAKKFYDKNKLDVTNGVTTNGVTKLDYIKFQLNVRVDQNGYIRLNAPYLTSGAGSEWVAGVEYTANNGVTVLPTTPMEYNILSASRMVVSPVGLKVSDADDAADLTEGRFQAAEAKSGVLAAVDGSQEKANAGNSLGLSNTGALEIYNAKYDDAASKLAALTNLTDVFTVTAAVNTFDFYAEAGEIYAFEIYIWVEGYDAECTNAVFAQSLACQFGFQYDKDGVDWAPYTFA